MTTDETWIYYYTSESKQQSRQWKHSDRPSLKKAKLALSAVKVMALIFWDAKRILLSDYIQKGQMVTREY